MINQIVVSGVQPTGVIHIGNYLGAFKNFLKLQNNFQCFFFIADLHSLTVPQKSAKLQEQIYELMAAFLALGINPEKATLFIQSLVPAHTELSWILSTITPLSYLKEMHQFKEKAKKQGRDVNAGLFTYPILQAADVLLYDADFVPVGRDQIQHIELIRDLAKRFNEKFGNVFKIPEVLVNEDLAKIMSLKNPFKKMSKSDSEKNYLGVFDEPDVIRKKILGAATDSGNEIIFDPKNKPAISNLLLIAAGILDKNIDDTIKILKSESYLKFKEKLADLIIEYFADARKKRQNLIKDKSRLTEIFIQGAKEASIVALKKLNVIKRALGIAF